MSGSGGLQAPQPLCLQGCTLGEWKKWDRRIDEYFLANFSSLPATRKFAMYKYSLGESWSEVLNQFNAETVCSLKEHIHGYLSSKTNTIFERFEFFKMRKEEMSCDDFLLKVMTKADLCGFGSERDNLIRDILVFNAPEGLQAKMLTRRDLTLQLATEMFRIHESTSGQVAQMNQSGQVAQMNQSGQVAQINQSGESIYEVQQNGINNQRRDGSADQRPSPMSRPRQFFRRSPPRPPRNNPVRCFNCGGLGHFQSTCPSKKKNNAGQSRHYSSGNWSLLYIWVTIK